LAASLKPAVPPGDVSLSRLVSEIANTPAIREALQFFARDKQRITEQQLQLCRVSAPTFFEQKRAEWVLAQFKALGAVARIDRGGNVIAHPVENREGPYVALTAHLDTVLAPRNIEEVSIDPDGRLHGPGVSDNGHAGRIRRIIPPVGFRRERR
jgi:tripeptide aminopeptidase